MRRPLLGAAMFVGLAVLLLLARPASAGPPVSLIEMDSAITPVTVRLLTTALDRAQAEHAQALIVQLNTPGGLERSMRSMVQTILGAPIPVIVYVAPTGARAASAGVFITMAAHVAAMAPATNIGAAHPVAVGGSMDKEMIKKVMDGDKMIPVDVLYPPAMVGTALEMTAANFYGHVPVRGVYTIDATLVTKDNAADYYFPESPF